MFLTCFFSQVLLSSLLSFILPIINLAQTSTQTPVAGGDTGEYEQTLAFGNYIQAFVENKEQFGRSFMYASLATIFALAIAYPLGLCNRL